MKTCKLILKIAKNQLLLLVYNSFAGLCFTEEFHQSLFWCDATLFLNHNYFVSSVMLRRLRTMSCYTVSICIKCGHIFLSYYVINGSCHQPHFFVEFNGFWCHPSSFLAYFFYRWGIWKSRNKVIFHHQEHLSLEDIIFDSFNQT